MSDATYPKFLSNAPIGKDLFESGSQQRTARSISSHIKTKDRSFKLLGLEGNFGSGKSNLISIVKSELGEQFHMFIYDSWSHQVDLQRRSFLEELTSNLQEANLLDKEKWTSRLAYLLAKKKETITKTVPQLSLAIIISLGVAVFTPITKSIADLIKTNTFWKPIITGSLFLIAVIAWIYYAIKNRQWRVTDLFYLYKEKELEHTTQETVSEKEPSVREFRLWMQELSKDASKQVIIVFDNMDRLPADKLQVAWSSIHTFFSEEVYENIWVIVPFSRSQINSAFKEESSLEEGGGFINKTFPVIFSVSPPVLTDWKEFLKTKYNEAFGNDEEGEFQIVKNLFDIYSLSITPRKIIAFINGLVSLKLAWNLEIKLRYMALYLLNKEKILKDPFTEILKEDHFSESRNLFSEDENIPDNIAALVYNVPLENAAQVTLSREITLCLREKNTEKLSALSGNKKFFDILEQVVRKELIDLDALVVSLNAIAPSEDDPEGKSMLHTIWSITINKFLSLQIVKSNFTETHKILIERAGSEKIRQVCDKIYEFISFEKGTAVEYYHNLKHFGEFIQLVGSIEFRNYNKSAAFKPEEYFEYLEEAKEESSEYPILCELSLLDNYLASNYPASSSSLTRLQYYSQRGKLVLLQGKIEEQLKSANNENDLLAALNAYKCQASEKPLPSIITDQQLQSIFQSLPETSPLYHTCIAMRLAQRNTFQYSYGLLEELVTNDPDPLLVEKVAAEIQWYMNYGDILLAATSWDNPLFKAVGKYLTIHDEGTTLAISQILPKFHLIIKAIEVTEHELIAKLNRWSKYIKKNVSVLNLPTIIPDTNFYELAIETDNKISKEILEVATSYLLQLDVDAYRKLFLDPKSYNSTLLYLLLKHQYIDIAPVAAIEGYKLALKEIIDRDADYVISPDRWAIFYEKHFLSSDTSTAKDIRDTLIRDSKITDNKFLFFERLLRECADLYQRAGDGVRNILNPIAREKKCTDIIVAHSDFYIQLLEKAEDDALEFIRTIRPIFHGNENSQQHQQFLARCDQFLLARFNLKDAQVLNGEHKYSATQAINDLIQHNKTLFFQFDGNLLKGIADEEIESPRLEIIYSWNGSEIRKIHNMYDFINLP